MDGNQHQESEGGPPKKGFWGFIAGFFPQRPSILEPPAPTANVSPKSDSSDTADSGPVGISDNAPETQEAQTDEKAAPNNEGEKNPPTVSVPQGVKSPTISENDDAPPTLPA